MCSDKIPVVITSSDPTLSQLNEAMNTAHKVMGDKIDELAQQGKKAHEEYNDVRKIVWEKIEAYLKQEGLFPESYNEEDDSLQLKDGVVFHVIGKRKERENNKAKEMMQAMKDLF